MAKARMPNPPDAQTGHRDLPTKEIDRQNWWMCEALANREREGELERFAYWVRDALLTIFTIGIYGILFEGAARARRCARRIERNLKYVIELSGVKPLPPDLFTRERMSAMVKARFGREAGRFSDNEYGSSEALEMPESFADAVGQKVADAITQPLLLRSAKTEGVFVDIDGNLLMLACAWCGRVFRVKPNHDVLCACGQRVVESGVLSVPVSFGY